MSWSDIDRKIAQESVPLKDFLAKNKYNWKTHGLISPKEISQGRYWNRGINPMLWIPCKCEANCWAKSFYPRLDQTFKNIKADKNGIKFDISKVDVCKLTGRPYVYAVQWLGDIAHESVDELYIAQIFHFCSFINYDRIQHGLRPHIFLFLTKWPYGLWQMLLDIVYYPGPLIPTKDGIYVGTTITDQNTCSLRLPGLIKFADAGFKIWVSYEPVYGPVDINYETLKKISQVVAGCETGPDRRLANLDWFRSIRDQCERAAISFFLKQSDIINGKRSRLLDGREYNNLTWRM